MGSRSPSSDPVRRGQLVASEIWSTLVAVKPASGRDQAVREHREGHDCPHAGANSTANAHGSAKAIASPRNVRAAPELARLAD